MSMKKKKKKAENRSPGYQILITAMGATQLSKIQKFNKKLPKVLSDNTEAASKKETQPAEKNTHPNYGWNIDQQKFKSFFNNHPKNPQPQISDTTEAGSKK